MLSQSKHQADKQCVKVDTNIFHISKGVSNSVVKESRSEGEAKQQTRDCTIMGITHEFRVFRVKQCLEVASLHAHAGDDLVKSMDMKVGYLQALLHSDFVCFYQTIS